jgi:REP element-mobilizing transposase RayT
MPNTYTQIHIHTVFAVQNRLCLIDKSWRDRLYQYIVSIIQNNGHKVLAIGGVGDHVHILFGFRPTESLSHLMQEVKRDSSAWINANHFVKGKFSWQIPNVCNYIETQEEHHRKRTFTEEYIDFLEEYGIEYDKRYIFNPID